MGVRWLGVFALACALACAGPPHHLAGSYADGRYISVRHWFSIPAPLLDPELSCSDESTESNGDEWASDGLRYGDPGHYTHKVGVVALPDSAAQALDQDPLGQALGALARREADYWRIPANADVVHDEWYDTKSGTALARVYHAHATSNTRESWLAVSVARVAPRYYAYAVVRNDAESEKLEQQVRTLFERIQLGPEVRQKPE
jgi:hypothetical protein